MASLLSSVFDKITVINSRRAVLLKRSFHQDIFPINTSEFYRALKKGIEKASFFNRIASYELPATMF